MHTKALQHAALFLRCPIEICTYIVLWIHIFRLCCDVLWRYNMLPVQNVQTFLLACLRCRMLVSSILCYTSICKYCLDTCSYCCRLCSRMQWYTRAVCKSCICVESDMDERVFCNRASSCNSLDATAQTRSRIVCAYGSVYVHSHWTESPISFTLSHTCTHTHSFCTLHSVVDFGMHFMRTGNFSMWYRM